MRIHCLFTILCCLSFLPLFGESLSHSYGIIPCEANAGPDQLICGEQSVQLQAEAIHENDVGSWTQSVQQQKAGVQILRSDQSQTQVTGLQIGQVYEFVWTVKFQDCENTSRDVVRIEMLRTDPAFAGLDQQSCGSNSILLEAILPDQTIGQWFAMNDQTTIENPNDPDALVMDLNPGKNGFIWSVQYPDCGFNSQDTVWINYVEAPSLNPIELETAKNERLEIDPAKMLNRSAEFALQFKLSEGPAFGSVEQMGDAGFAYQPFTDFNGYDSWRLEACRVACPSLCSDLEIAIKVADGIVCKAPSIITPNGDGANDAFVIPCLDQYPDAELIIFNGRGEQLFQKRPYQNDWIGRYNGEDLPSGTYFYVLDLNNKTHDMLQGFFMLHR